jgi:gamma-glutamylcyclotransferase (GGCT)/AIG2-like uncharacterized protein YtfP
VSQRVFCYGSLVHPATRPKSARASGPANLPGWRRTWNNHFSTPNGGMCTLTIEPSPGTAIVGVVLHCDDPVVADLDRSEPGYEHRAVAVAEIATGAAHDCIAYVATGEHRGRASDAFPIWRSYLDLVLAGYFALGGAAAVDGFITSTAGWSGPILDDRDAPRFAGAVPLSPAEARAIDAVLARHGVLAKDFGR